MEALEVGAAVHFQERDYIADISLIQSASGFNGKLMIVLWNFMVKTQYPVKLLC